MREPLEMITASRMQNMVQIREKNLISSPKSVFVFYFVTFTALGVESPRGGAIYMSSCLVSHLFIHINMYTYTYISIYIRVWGKGGPKREMLYKRPEKVERSCC